LFLSGVEPQGNKVEMINGRGRSGRLAIIEVKGSETMKDRSKRDTMCKKIIYHSF
jgi:hypothetical protein